MHCSLSHLFRPNRGSLSLSVPELFNIIKHLNLAYFWIDFKYFVIQLVIFYEMFKTSKQTTI